jgi:hypothetical protein
MGFPGPTSSVDNLVISILNLGQNSNVNERTDEFLKILLPFRSLGDCSYCPGKFLILNHKE